MTGNPSCPNTSDFITTDVGVIYVQETLGWTQRGILDIDNRIRGALSGLTKDFGSITRGFRIGPLGERIPLPIKRDDPEAVETGIATRMIAANYMERFDACSRLGIYIQQPSSQAGLPLDYSRIDILVDTGLANIEYGDFTVDEGLGEEVIVTTNVNAAALIRVLPVEASQVATAFSSSDDTAYNDITIDLDGNLYAVSASESSGKPYGSYSTNGGTSWTEVVLTDVVTDADAVAIEVIGDFLYVLAGDFVYIYNKTFTTLQDSYDSGSALTDIMAFDAANIVICGAAGFVQISADGGVSWTTVTAVASVALEKLAGRNINNWFVSGASNNLWHYQSGTFSAITAPTARASASLNAIGIPIAETGFQRDNDIYIGYSDGYAYKSRDDGVNWTELVFPGNEAGAVIAIEFTEFLGQVMYLLHTPVDGSSDIYRDFSGGLGGVNSAELVSSIPTNTGLNAIELLNGDALWSVGAVHSGADMFVKVIAS